MSVTDRVEKGISTPAIAQFLYYFVIVTTGLFFLRFSIEGGLIFSRSVSFMSVWFILIISLQPPKGADFEMEPFAHVGIIDGDRHYCSTCGTSYDKTNQKCPQCGKQT